MIIIARVVKAPEERRAELISVAQKLFFEKGYNDTTVRDIIKAVNGSQGMFYHHFKSKDEIFHVVMEQFISNYICELREIFYSREANGLKKLNKVIDKFQNAYNSSLSLVNQSNNPENVHFMLELKGKIVDGIIDPMNALINEFIDEGIIDAKDIINKNTKSTALFLAHGLFGLINGYKSNLISECIINKTKRNEILSFISRTLGQEDNFFINK